MTNPILEGRAGCEVFQNEESGLELKLGKLFKCPQDSHTWFCSFKIQQELIYIIYIPQKRFRLSVPIKNASISRPVRRRGVTRRCLSFISRVWPPGRTGAARTGRARAPLLAQPLGPKEAGLAESSLMSNDWVCLGWGRGWLWAGMGRKSRVGSPQNRWAGCPD